MSRTGSIFATVAAIALCAIPCTGCGKSKQEQDCEKLEDRVAKISAGVTLELYKLDPTQKAPARQDLENDMRRTLDEGTFMSECLKLEPGEVDCLANATTKEQWKACGFDDLALP